MSEQSKIPVKGAVWTKDELLYAINKELEIALDFFQQIVEWCDDPICAEGDIIDAIRNIATTVLAHREGNNNA